MKRLPARWLLYVAADCELCDHAVHVLAQARAPDFECVDIEKEASLVERYGVRVPVLHDVAGNRDLGWPFDVLEARRFLSAGMPPR
ncbi:MAG: glutaredoxin family protein [Dokdonella sp.]|uniref:glutaredoxin family protein n=1 Tax=Dokdonella sp. TaxID=2291710 RepID=UPI002B524183|nr:glutaredoxin family protein [Dokdonella sp.]HOX72780.1 glutaredoxin family protein [Dokdonella sp.]HPN80289.1 glutaredoxin family protein [Dokdonella sp.]